MLQDGEVGREHGADAEVDAVARGGGAGEDLGEGVELGVGEGVEEAVELGAVGGVGFGLDVADVCLDGRISVVGAG